MAKRNNGPTRKDAATTTIPSDATPTQGMEQRVLAFAEQVGRTTAKRKKPAAAAALKVKKGRSGGVVDAPGKKHRRQAPPDPDATSARRQASKMRTAMPMAKTTRRRGRG